MAQTNREKPVDKSKYLRTILQVLSMVALACCHAVSCLAQVEDTAAKIDRSIGKEPQYRTKPRYALLLLGAEAKTPTWIVQDDDQLYIDKNRNRDLTDDGPTIQATAKRYLDKTTWDRNFVSDGWELANGSKVQNFDLRHWNYAAPEDQYGLSLTVDNNVPLYAGWNALLSPTTKEAPLLHFGGPVAPRMIRYQKFVLGTKPGRLSITFGTPANLKLASVRLSIEGLAASVKPIANIKWPTKTADPPLITSHVLTERCCYWEFYTENFQIPDNATTGNAKVTIIVPPDEFPLELAVDHFDAPVVSK